MPIIMKIAHFATKGMRTLHFAARGCYDGESDAVRLIREEMLSQPSGGFNDALNMRRDRMQVGRDTRISFKKIKAKYE